MEKCNDCGKESGYYCLYGDKNVICWDCGVKKEGGLMFKRLVDQKNVYIEKLEKAVHLLGEHRAALEKKVVLLEKEKLVLGNMLKGEKENKIKMRGAGKRRR